MKIRGQNQSKIMKFITIPFRILGKARDLYVRSLTDCSRRVSHGGELGLGTGLYSPALPRSISSGFNDGGEDYKELIRAASVRNLGHRNEAEMLMKKSRGLPKSCSVGMGRIDEDKPCEFGEDDGEPEVKADLGFPMRSRSCTVGKRNIPFV